MAYAVLAGMPPVYGLYTAIVPPLVYALLGTSRQLSLGPFAITSLLLNTTCAQLASYEDGSPEYVSLAMTISFCAGLITMVLGFLKMGLLTNFLSQSVLTGFITASACVIILSQIKYILGKLILFMRTANSCGVN
jgi:SulP family sulfate permease